MKQRADFSSGIRTRLRFVALWGVLGVGEIKQRKIFLFPQGLCHLYSAFLRIYSLPVCAYVCLGWVKPTESKGFEQESFSFLLVSCKESERDPFCALLH